MSLKIFYYHRRRAISPVIATIALIIVAAAAAAIGGSQLIQKTTLAARPATTIEITDMFMIKLPNAKAHMHVEYAMSPDWTAASATFKDDTGNTVTFSLSPNTTTSDQVINAAVTTGQTYNIILAIDGPGGSATSTKVVFAR